MEIRIPFDFEHILGYQTTASSKQPEASGTSSTVVINVINNHVTNNYYGAVSSSEYFPPKGGRGKMKTFVVLTHGEDGYYIAECPALPGCISQGRTKEEAIDNIKEAIEVTIETRRELGLPDFEEVIEVEV